MIKDPAANKDYGFDWSAWMGSGDTILTSAFSAGACSVTSASVTSHTTMCFIGSGAAGSTERVSNRITTSMGRTDERSFPLQIINL